MPQKFPSKAAAAGAAVMAAALAGAYFLVSGDPPSTAPPAVEISGVPASAETGAPGNIDLRPTLAAALKAGLATCRKDVDFYRGIDAAQILLTVPPRLERYVEPKLLAAVGGDAYDRLSEHPKELDRSLLALRAATHVDRAPSGAPQASPPAAPSDAVPQSAEALARAQEERERVLESLRSAEFDGVRNGLITIQRGAASSPAPTSDAVPPQSAEALARAQEERERVLESLRGSELDAAANGLITLQSTVDSDRVAARKQAFIAKMESFCADILEVAEEP